MPEFRSYPPGTPSWVDLASPDLEASKAFYTGLFDWGVNELGSEAGGYTFFLKDGRNVAGLGPIAVEGQPAAWTTYVDVESADATVAKAREAGATVFVEPMDVMEAGRMAVMADPTGAVIGLWQPGGHQGADLANEPGTFCWNELQTRDTAAAAAFYSAVFGWRINAVDMPGMEYSELLVGDKSVAGMMPMPADVPPEAPAHWLTYFAVDDCEATVKAATDADGMNLVPPTDIPPGRFAVLADPSGALFAVIQMAAAQS